MRDLLPEDAAHLQDASAAGWTGMTIVETPAGATLVVSAEADVLAARDRLWLGMCLDPPDRPRLLRVRLVSGDEGDAPPAGIRARGGASLDLAYPEGRALVRGVADRGLLWIVFMEAGRGDVAAIEHIHVGEAVGFLRDAVARAGEWHPAPLAPPELTESAWRAAAARAPCLAPSAEDTTAVLVVPHETLAGLGDTCGELVVRAPDPGAAWDRIELVLAWGGDPRRIALDLRRPCQRDLAWRLARRREITVIAAGEGPEDPAGARLTASLGPVSRALLHRAGRGR
jgi:hypothetical protein